MKKKSDIQARLTVYGIGEMNKRGWTRFIKWIEMIYQEFHSEDKAIYNQKRFRHTLYKP